MLLIKIFSFFREDLICIVKRLFSRSLIMSLKLPCTLMVCHFKRGTNAINSLEYNFGCEIQQSGKYSNLCLHSFFSRSILILNLTQILPPIWKHYNYTWTLAFLFVSLQSRFLWESLCLTSSY